MAVLNHPVSPTSLNNTPGNERFVVGTHLLPNTEEGGGHRPLTST